MTDIVVVGSLNMDMIARIPRLPASGETILSLSYHVVPGGKGANQAFAAAKLGGKVAMLGRVGTDDHGEAIRASLQSVECDVTGIQQTDCNSGIALILVTQSGENQIVVVPGANSRYLPSDFHDDAKYLVGAKFVLLQLEIPLDTVVAAARAAKQQGAQVILDPAPVSAHFPSDLFRSLDVITPNETEAAQLMGNQVGSLSRDQARDIARQLQKCGTKTVIVKLGERGCILADGDAIEAIEAPVVSAVDTTAAGDVFNAAFAVACADGASHLAACQFAVQAAALSVTRLGAQTSMPSYAEVRQVFD